jgi:hypothetical protein
MPAAIGCSGPRGRPDLRRSGATLGADNDRLYDEALVREYDRAFHGGRAQFELRHRVAGDGHPLQHYPTGGG